MEIKIFIYFNFLLLVLITSCSTQLDSQDSINKGLNYLAQAKTNDFSYNDEYLKYVYSGEALECNLPNCKITYRKLDAYFNLKFIKNEFQDYSLIKQDVEEADKILASLIPIWRNKKLYNIVNETMKDTSGLALDTYCILGYLYNDKEMSTLVLNSLYNDEWLPSNFYQGDQDFRTIADESWCVRLISKSNNKELIRDVKDRLIKDTYTFINEDHDKITKVNAAIHTLTMLNEFNENDKEINFFKNYIATSISDKQTWQDTTTLANILDVLVQSNYSNKAIINKLTRELIKRQEKDGRWLISKCYDKNFGQVFTTFRVIAALNKYQQWQK